MYNKSFSRALYIISVDSAGKVIAYTTLIVQLSKWFKKNKKLKGLTLFK